MAVPFFLSVPPQQYHRHAHPHTVICETFNLHICFIKTFHKFPGNHLPGSSLGNQTSVLQCQHLIRKKKCLIRLVNRHEYRIAPARQIFYLPRKKDTMNNMASTATLMHITVKKYLFFLF